MDGFFEVSMAARRRAKIRASLPTDPPEQLVDQRGGRTAAHLPDPEVLCAEERAAAMTAVATALNQIHAYLSDLADAADAQGDSRVLRAGTTSTLVATTTGSTPAVGAGIVHTAQTTT